MCRVSPPTLSILYTVILAASAALPGVCLAGPVLLFDQTGACSGNGPASQQFPDFGFSVIQSADDFTVPMGLEWTIDRAFARGAFFNANPNNGPIDAVVVQIWSDNGGLPDTLLCEESGANEEVDPNTALTLTGACAGIMPLGEGTYWISIMASMPFIPAGQYAWVPNDGPGGTAEFAFQDPDGLTGNPCITWGAGITTCGVGATFPDMCFGLEGTEGSSLVSVTINFDDLLQDTVVHDQYPEATFSSPDGLLKAIAFADAPSPPHILCSVSAAGPTCVSDFQVDFTTPVSGLSLQAIGAKSMGTVAQVLVHPLGLAPVTVDVHSPGGNGMTPILVDLTAFSDVTRIDIFNVTDPAGVGWDDFDFLVMPPSPQLFADGFESGDTSAWSAAPFTPSQTQTGRKEP